VGTVGCDGVYWLVRREGRFEVGVKSGAGRGPEVFGWSGLESGAEV